MWRICKELRNQERGTYLVIALYMYCTRSNDYNSLRLLNPHPRNESIHSIKHMQQWFEMISVQVGQKCLWLEMTATHVFMWEWLEDKLLFNSVLIGSGVIALCFFFLSFFFVRQQLLTDVVVGSEWMTDSGFSGGGEKNKQSAQCLSEVYPSPLPPCLPSLGSW